MTLGVRKGRHNLVHSKHVSVKTRGLGKYILAHFGDYVFTITKNIILTKNFKYLATWENSHSIKRKTGVNYNYFNLIKNYVALLKKQ